MADQATVTHIDVSIGGDDCPEYMTELVSQMADAGLLELCHMGEREPRTWFRGRERGEDDAPPAGEQRYHPTDFGRKVWAILDTLRDAEVDAAKRDLVNAIMEAMG